VREQGDGLPPVERPDRGADQQHHEQQSDPPAAHRASDRHPYQPAASRPTSDGPGADGTCVPADVDLSDDDATDPSLVGSKAAALAAAARLGLPVLPGFVLTTAFDGVIGPDVLRRFDALSDGGRRPLVVRSSSTIEDDLDSSMAGRFTSVVGVVGRDAFERAVADVLASAASAGPVEPMAALVQPLLDARCGGVLFGLDPVTGDRRRLVVEVVEGGPQRLVSGVATATRYVLSGRGRSVERVRGGPPLLGPVERRRLAALAARTAAAFGGPQDVEWAFDHDGRLWLFQSRPITAVGGAAETTGPILGPGPIAETFPEPLRRLERDLWLDPLRAALRSALRVVGAVPRRRLDRSPVVVDVRGRPAADLELLGALPRRRSLWRALDPTPPARRLAAAWRIGRLRRLLPDRCARLVEETDRRLAGVPAPSRLSDLELRWLLSRIRQALVAVQGHEVLAGMLLRDPDGRTATAIALDRLALAGSRGLSSPQTVARWPVVLALVPPRIGDGVQLPEPPPRTEPLPFDVSALGPREALRLRARWLQELAARAATELGRRLHAAGGLAPEVSVRDLTLAQLGRAVDGETIDPGEVDRPSAPPAPLPAAFRLTASGDPVPVRSPGRLGLAGTGAAEGRVVGRVHQLCEGPPDEGEILVVRVLDPSLAAALPSVTGLVSETGSTLSHLAILAREMHCPTVVGVEDALRRFPPGALVLVDGSTGEVSLLPADGEGAA
jgi:pyruvate,water dikinase